MKIKATSYYYDRQLKKHIQAGDEYTVANERGKELVSLKLAKEVKAAANTGEK